MPAHANRLSISNTYINRVSYNNNENNNNNNEYLSEICGLYNCLIKVLQIIVYFKMSKLINSRILKSLFQIDLHN